MGLFDFIKKDKKQTDKQTKKNKKGDKSIDFDSIDNISPEDLKLAKEKRLKNDSRTQEDKLKDETFRSIAMNHNNRNNRIAAVMEMKSQDVLEDLAMDNKDRYVRTISASRITDSLLPSATRIADFFSPSARRIASRRSRSAFICFSMAS